LEGLRGVTKFCRLLDICGCHSGTADVTSLQRCESSRSLNRSICILFVCHSGTDTAHVSRRRL